MNMGFLDQILPEVSESIHRRDYAAGLPASRTGSPSSLRESIRERRTALAVVAEYKRVSPGYVDARLPERSIRDFIRLAEGHRIAGFSALACGPRFEGSPRQVWELAHGTPLPVLFKDFVVDPVQIDAAARSGAAAILLIARLEREKWINTSLAELAHRAHERGLEVLLEFHDPREVELAGGIPADLYGVNVRDLDTLRMEPARTEETFHRAAALRPLLVLSGVRNPDDAARFRRLGTDGLLVGTALAKSADPVNFLEELSQGPREMSV